MGLFADSPQIRTHSQVSAPVRTSPHIPRTTDFKTTLAFADSFVPPQYANLNVPPFPKHSQGRARSSNAFSDRSPEVIRERTGKP
eukprot:10724935-Heterocapsa_arctica.AAC.1